MTNTGRTFYQRFDVRASVVGVWWSLTGAIFVLRRWLFHTAGLVGRQLLAGPSIKHRVLGGYILENDENAQKFG